MKTTSDLTIDYIKEHPYIKACLKKGLINYSALSRLISNELKIEKKTSMEAILIAARRYQSKLSKETNNEKKIRDILSKTEIEVKNKVSVYIINKNIDMEQIDNIQKIVRKEHECFFLVEGSNNYTIITKDRYKNLLNKFRNKIIHEQDDLVLINLKSPEEIEKTKGVMAYLTSLFAENDVNIVEHLSCWTHTLFVIESKELNKAIKFLNF